MARQAVRRVPPPRTLVLDSTADLQAFRQSINKRWALPSLRIALRLPGLRSLRVDHYERLINRQLRLSGGWAALWTAIVLTGLAIAFPVPPAGPESIEALSAWLAQVALAWVLGWAVGKCGAIAIAHRRVVRLCRQVEAEVTAPAMPP
ncbi:MAG: hypothetical protein ABW190_09780 [Rhizobacter sp.]